MKRFKGNVIKEAFDNLPSGICFFDKNGMVTLCNHQMHRLVFALTGRDLQSLTELETFLEEERTEKKKDNDLFLLKDGSAWHFFKERVTTREGKVYTQITASDVTELYYRQKELEEENKKLEEYAERMRRLSANVITLIREEEILNMKMRVHDDIGRSVIATRKFLQQNRPMEELDLTTWKNAVRLLKHDNEQTEDKDTLAKLMCQGEGIGIKIILDGELPGNSSASELLFAAIRECMTNAVRHAGAKKLYVHITCDEEMACGTITNDGVPPEKEIAEGGGLSSLRIRIKKYGGSMKIRSTPDFALTVCLPVRLEGFECSMY